MKKRFVVILFVIAINMHAMEESSLQGQSIDRDNKKDLENRAIINHFQAIESALYEIQDLKVREEIVIYLSTGHKMLFSMESQKAQTMVGHIDVITKIGATNSQIIENFNEYQKILCAMDSQRRAAWYTIIKNSLNNYRYQKLPVQLEYVLEHKLLEQIDNKGEIAIEEKNDDLRQLGVLKHELLQLYAKKRKNNKTRWR